MKYVILEKDGLELPIIFPDIIDHSTFAHIPRSKPISAGFLEVYGDDCELEGATICEKAIKVYAHGMSVSLKLSNRPEDSDILARELMRHYN